MEFPDVGTHCSKSNCNKLDFLPIKCDGCSEIFCEEHYSYLKHDCLNAYKKNNQVPVCPLCNIPIPIPAGQQPDAVVGLHIDNDCQSDPAKTKRKVFTNKCSLKGCKVKEVIPVVCNDCNFNYCLKHRHPQDHHCERNQRDNKNSKLLNAALARQKHTNNIQDNMSEDEALARALALSMQDSLKTSPQSQEDLDLAFARQLQASEYQAQGTTATGSRSSLRDKCSVA